MCLIYLSKVSSRSLCMLPVVTPTDHLPPTNDSAMSETLQHKIAPTMVHLLQACYGNPDQETKAELRALATQWLKLFEMLRYAPCLTLQWCHCCMLSLLRASPFAEASTHGVGHSIELQWQDTLLAMAYIASTSYFVAHASSKVLLQQLQCPQLRALIAGAHSGKCNSATSANSMCSPK